RGFKLGTMHIAVEGCSHGELDTIYDAILRLQEIHNLKVDLLLCCGDFQAVRNEGDLKCMAVPLKFMNMCDFYKYHSGEKVAPILTIFIGGNHEASNYLQEHPYGGWVAPNIYYLGYASIVKYGGLRIGGMSGIYKGHDYLKGHFEKPPYSQDTIRSIYHVRNLDVFRLKQLSGNMDIFMSHDWPRGIYAHGNKEKLIRKKAFFREEIEKNTLGSRAAEDLLKKMQPNYWFSGHLHVKFPALVKHQDDNSSKPKTTKFLALDKCLPRREFLQIVQIPHDTSLPLEFSHDAEWLTILRLTNQLLSTQAKNVYMPGPGSEERYQFTPSESEIKETIELMNGDLTIPVGSFVRTAQTYNASKGKPKMNLVQMPKPVLNPTTIAFCDKLGIDDPLALLLGAKKKANSSPRSSRFNESELNITLDNSKISYVPDESPESDEDNDCDILVEMKHTREDSIRHDEAFEVSLSPIRRCDSNGLSSTSTSGSTDSLPAASSPRIFFGKRKGLSLSQPKSTPGGGGSSSSSSSSPLAASLPDSSSSLDECESRSEPRSESSPIRSPQHKRDLEEADSADSTEAHEAVPTPPSSAGSLHGENKKLFKRRNQSLYSSAEDE
ncbi:unnamed protein product, partial [Meganyctiphanes norvegica]